MRKYESTCLLAVRFPDGTLVPVFDGWHAKEIIRRNDNWPELVIEYMSLKAVDI